MYKRLYFLSPDANHAQTVVNELVEFDINRDHMHTMAKHGVDLGDLPRASLRQRRDMANRPGGLCVRIHPDAAHHGRHLYSGSYLGKCTRHPSPGIST